MHCPGQTLTVCMLHGFWFCFAHSSNAFVAPKLVQCMNSGCYWQLICSKKCNCGLEHAQPAQRTVSKVIFDGFSWCFDPPDPKPKWGPNWAVDAPRTGTSSAQLGPHFGPLSVKKQRTGSSRPKEHPGNTNITFSCTSLNQEHQQGWGGLGFYLIAGWARTAASRPAPAARP